MLPIISGTTPFNTIAGPLKQVALFYCASPFDLLDFRLLNKSADDMARNYADEFIERFLLPNLIIPAGYSKLEFFLRNPFARRPEYFYKTKENWSIDTPPSAANTWRWAISNLIMRDIGEDLRSCDFYVDEVDDDATKPSMANDLNYQKYVISRYLSRGSKLGRGASKQALYMALNAGNCALLRWAIEGNHRQVIAALISQALEFTGEERKELLRNFMQACFFFKSFPRGENPRHIAQTANFCLDSLLRAVKNLSDQNEIDAIIEHAISYNPKPHMLVGDAFSYALYSGNSRACAALLHIAMQIKNDTKRDAVLQQMIRMVSNFLAEYCTLPKHANLYPEHPYNVIPILVSAIEKITSEDIRKNLYRDLFATNTAKNSSGTNTVLEVLRWQRDNLGLIWAALDGSASRAHSDDITSVYKIIIAIPDQNYRQHNLHKAITHFTRDTICYISDVTLVQILQEVDSVDANSLLDQIRDRRGREKYQEVRNKYYDSIVSADGCSLTRQKMLELLHAYEEKRKYWFNAPEIDALKDLVAKKEGQKAEISKDEVKQALHGCYSWWRIRAKPYREGLLDNPAVKLADDNTETTALLASLGKHLALKL